MLREIEDRVIVKVRKKFNILQAARKIQKLAIRKFGWQRKYSDKKTDMKGKPEQNNEVFI